MYRQPSIQDRGAKRIGLSGMLAGLLGSLASAASAAAQTSIPSAPSPMIIAASQAEKAPSDQPLATPHTGIWSRNTFTGDWGGRRRRIEDSGIKLGLQEQIELWANLDGGLRHGATSDGLTTASLTIDLGKLAGWTGTSVFVNAYQIYGRGPSSKLIGNLQLASNIEATRDTRLYDLWLETAALDGRLNFRFGQEGINDEMMITQYGASFLNSSFGTPGTSAAALPSGGPNYPLATPFVRLRYHLGGGFTLVGALFNGDPAPAGTGDPQARDAGGTAFRLDGHALAAAEIWYAPNPSDSALPTTYKLGMWYHTGRFADQVYDASGRPLASLASNGLRGQHETDYAIYAIVDQPVWRRPNADGQGIGLFVEVLGAPGDRNLSNLSILGGMNWRVPFASRENDLFGLAVAYEAISPSARRFSRDVAETTGAPQYSSNETVIEATYIYQVAPWWTLQPDAQFTINPGANIPSGLSSKPLKNAFTTGVRATITF